MAVSALVFSVIVRNLSVERHLPEGQDDLEQACPNSTFCSDGTISRIGFMALEDATAFIDWLRSVGFIVLRDGKSDEVALTYHLTGFLYQCDWLELGVFEGHPIAWLKGSDPGTAYIPAFERGSPTHGLRPSDFNEQYEFVEKRDNLDVYRNKITGEEVYVGRTQSEDTSSEQMSEVEQARWQHIYYEAIDLVKGELIFDNLPRPGKLDAVVSKRLSSALHLLEESIEILPRAWASYFWVGKIHERFGDYTAALQAYQRALEIIPAHPILTKEASVAAFNLGMYTTAMELTKIALQVNPKDPALHSNLGVSYLLQGNAQAALSPLEMAQSLEPENNLTQLLLNLVHKVCRGEAPCPSTAHELQECLLKE